MHTLYSLVTRNALVLLRNAHRNLVTSARLFPSVQVASNRISFLSKHGFSTKLPTSTATSGSMEVDKQAKNLIEAGNEFFIRGELEKALQSYQKSVEIKRMRDNVYQMANVYFLLERYSESLHCFKESIELDPNFVDAHVNLGNLYALRGEYESALIHYEKAKSMNAQDGQIFYNLGCIYDKLNRLEEAIAHYEKAIKLDPSIPSVNLRNAKAKLSSRKQTLDLKNEK